jgi:hypothetical protein
MLLEQRQIIILLDSVFAKKGERDKFYVGDGSSGSDESYFDLTNGTVLGFWCKY